MTDKFNSIRKIVGLVIVMTTFGSLAFVFMPACNYTIFACNCVLDVTIDGEPGVMEEQELFSCRHLGDAMDWKHEQETTWGDAITCECDEYDSLCLD